MSRERKEKRHKCRDCGAVRNESYMMADISLTHGVPTAELQGKKPKVFWVCGNCTDNPKRTD